MVNRLHQLFSPYLAPIPVTRPSLPPIHKVYKLLRTLWRTRQLSNNGTYHRNFEHSLCNYLGNENISLFSNGTLALFSALRVLNLKGEVITTPFTFAATGHAILLNQLKPVFVDISPNDLNMNVDKIEQSITPNTSAILAVHCYGCPSDLHRLRLLADKYSLKLICDAAHCFGVTQNKQNIYHLADMSILSFHATKAFNTFEGGAVISKDSLLKHQLDLFKNFGISGEESISGVGINAKMNEFQAGIGLLQLQYVDSYISSRKKIAQTYTEALTRVKGLRYLHQGANFESNYSYYPVLIDPIVYGCTRDYLYQQLRENKIYARKYFYPLLSTTTPYSSLPSANPENLPQATELAKRVLCLPIFEGMSRRDVLRVVEVLKTTSENLNNP